MIDLNNIEDLRKLDPQGAIESTDLLPEQLETAWQEVNNLDISIDTKHIKNIIFCGMGASIYGALVVKSLLGSKFPFPAETISDYHLPEYADRSTLVILTSYSGTTEEVLSCARDAKKRKTKILILTKGGELAKFAKENSIPSYIFDGKLNPAGIPRLGNGYTIIGLIGLLYKSGMISFDVDLFEKAINDLPTKIDLIRDTTKKYAKTLQGWIPIVFAAEHLAGNAQIVRNQFNETSKSFSAYFLIPDLNHHLMEGLRFPENIKIRFLTFQSNNYSDKNRQRTDLTVNVVKKNNRKIDVYKTTGTNVFDDFLEVLSYGSYLTLWLGFLNRQNPATNPWVDYFKEQLSK